VWRVASAPGGRGGGAGGGMEIGQQAVFVGG